MFLSDKQIIVMINLHENFHDFIKYDGLIKINFQYIYSLTYLDQSFK